MTKKAHFSDLVGKTLISIDGCRAGSDTITFTCSDGTVYRQLQDDYLGDVFVESVNGDTQNIIGRKIVIAEEKSNVDAPPRKGSESYTWTFYTIATVKGYLDIRWYGESNGYYSETADFEEVCKA